MKYRLLKKGECVKMGDEFFSPSSHCWIRSVNYPGFQSKFKYRRPLKSNVAASSTSSNISYTAALREKCRKYFPESIGQKRINNFIKSVQRLNAAEKRRTAHS